MPDRNEEIEIRSEEVQEILSHVPNWMIRWGITLIFLLLLVFLFLSWLVKYPDVITGTVTINTEVPGVKLVNKFAGEIETIHIPDNQPVKKGDLIAVINNPLSYEAKMELDSIHSLYSKMITNDSIQEIELTDPKSTFGSLQTDYSNLTTAIQEYKQLLDVRSLTFKIENLRNQIENNITLRSVTYQMLKTSKDQFEKATEKLEIDRDLYSKNVISKMEFYEREKNYFHSKNEMEQLKKSSIQHTITISNLEKELNQLELDFDTQKKKLTLEIQNLLSSLENGLKNWSMNYEVVSPTNGQLSYIAPLHPNQYVDQGKELFAILPNKEQFIAHLMIPLNGYGKVETGQTVRIKLDNFPYQEFGQVNGTVEEVSLLPNENQYLVAVSLPDGLMSSYNKQLNYSPEMSGTAEIITKDLRLIERIFNQFKSLFDQ